LLMAFSRATAQMEKGKVEISGITLDTLSTNNIYWIISFVRSISLPLFNLLKLLCIFSLVTLTGVDLDFKNYRL
jgi:hypothetical protein